MSNKKWLLAYATTFLLTMSLFGLVNYVVDPFLVFQSHFLKRSGQINERYVKIEFLEKNHHKFNSYMFGSSRIGVVEPEVIEQYIPKSKFYNFTLSSGNLHDYMVHLKYFLKRDYEIKNLYMQIDIDDMHYYDHDASDYLCKLHPYVMGESLLVAKMKYLFGFFPLNVRKKISVNFEKDSSKKFDIAKGTWSTPSNEKKLEENPDMYVKNEASFHIKNRRAVRYIREKEAMEALKTIVNLCHENRIKLYVFTSAHNQNQMDTYILKDYNKFLRDISEITSFYDFSGYNSVSMNNANYYEESHYRPLVGALMAARIFHNNESVIPKDFGKFIAKGSLRGKR